MVSASAEPGFHVPAPGALGQSRAEVAPGTVYRGETTHLRTDMHRPKNCLESSTHGVRTLPLCSCADLQGLTLWDLSSASHNCRL